MTLKSIQEPITGQTVFSLSNPVSGVMNMVGLALGLGALWFLLGVGQNEVAPTLNSLVGRLTGGRVDSGQGGASFGEVL